MSERNLITSAEFVSLTQIDLYEYSVLLTENKLPAERINRHLYIDINDRRARQYLPDYKIEKDLF
jgi:hypothetical protein